MNRRLQFTLVLFLAVVISSMVSHLAVGWLRIRSTRGTYQPYGAKDLNPKAILHCSSLGYSAIDWSRVSEALDGGIASYATGGSSPSEWEVMQAKSQAVTRTFIVVSAMDLNEYSVCDFRGNIVPLVQTLRDLRQSQADRGLCKRILRRYGLAIVRALFPTVGRSDGVMTGIRAKLQMLSGGVLKADASAAPTLGSTGTSEDDAKVTDWPKARLERRLVLLRTACEGKFSFNGPKKLALVRLLQRAEMQGKVVLIVVPVPPLYHREFLTPMLVREFEEELREVLQLCPGTVEVRLDKFPALDNNELYSDTVHMNMYGQQIATAAFLERVHALRSSR